MIPEEVPPGKSPEDRPSGKIAFLDTYRNLFSMKIAETPMGTRNVKITIGKGKNGISLDSRIGQREEDIMDSVYINRRAEYGKQECDKLMYWFICLIRVSSS